MVETILPGTYITVRDEGLISVGGIASGNIGIVGTAAQGAVDEVKVISSFAEGKEIFGEADNWQGGNKNELTLIRALELVYNNGGQTVYAVRTAGKSPETPPGKEEYQKSLALLENEIINIVLVAGQDNSVAWLQEVIEGHLKVTAGTKRERIAIVGSSLTNGKDNLDAIAEHTFNNERIIFTAPGIVVAGKNKTDTLPGGYLAAAVAGLIASLPVQASPTNKTLSLGGLSSVFNAAQLEKLVSNRVLAVEKRDGFRVVKGITTNDAAWRQITTRRIVDYAIYGVRSACNPYIGKLNNDRVRGAMKATLDAFLTRMVNDEALVGYELNVSATRAQEIAGEAIVTLTLKPTFSIDFIKVTMYLG
jgi:hypothetical protein